MKINMVIPVFNEADNIISTLNEIVKIKHLCDLKVYICYDFEEDSTLTSIKKNNFDKNLKIYFVKNNSLGPHSAVMTGINYSDDYDYIIVLPADDDYNIKNFPKLFHMILKNSPDIVCMSRFLNGNKMENGPLLKTFIMRLVNIYLKFIAGLPTSDATNGFRIFSKRLVKNVKISTKKGFTYSLEYLVKGYKLGFLVLEFPAYWKERKMGQSRFMISKWAIEYISLCILATVPKIFFKKNKFIR